MDLTKDEPRVQQKFSGTHSAATIVGNAPGMGSAARGSDDDAGTVVGDLSSPLTTAVAEVSPHSAASSQDTVISGVYPPYTFSQPIPVHANDIGRAVAYTSPRHFPTDYNHHGAAPSYANPAATNTFLRQPTMSMQRAFNTSPYDHPSASPYNPANPVARNSVALFGAAAAASAISNSFDSPLGLESRGTLTGNTMGNGTLPGNSPYYKRASHMVSSDLPMATTHPTTLPMASALRTMDHHGAVDSADQHYPARNVWDFSTNMNNEEYQEEGEF